MKSARHRFCLMVLLLTLGVAGREMPESLSLTDDVSNDGECSIWDADSVPQLLFVRPSPSSRQESSLTAISSLPQFGWAHLLSGLSHHVIQGPDLLHRLALQRK
jgi:hypothetical protein